ncbi:methyltransferase domain-containing protein [Mesorhizobium sp. B2-5-13]|uniref:methyltransferase domain-containing protein n=1 Tax=unclassified Mesorhizobium TaxID=325217 RepID=UPI00112B56A3|nr:MULTISPECIES: methyltransferase domain-containing protein [unclassified Mesorhizobium]TPJ42644.1 methyltransferase domain-containing protein [Mesorhizobium sp. B2-6-5]TPJ93621.1 methyltransferase domain-containing protein [Mesorhizobium sp. B2-5-13]TPK48464.1 methyltransferase domain-containing protein [Mesorhizobium sp. B2-5-5]
MATGLDSRHIQPELLDHLPPDDPKAIGSRRDLIWINSLMFQHAIMSSLLKASVREGSIRILEVGSGDGAFMLSVARRLARKWIDVELVMLDQVDLITDRRRADFAALGWRVETVTDNVFDWIAKPGGDAYDVVSANLFLHHFSDAALKTLFEALRRLAPVFLAAEPSRNVVALKACSLLRLVGVNQVTMHDAAASVRAGFAGKELSGLWPLGSAQQCEERRIGPFTHAFRVFPKEGFARCTMPSS